MNPSNDHLVVIMQKKLLRLICRTITVRLLQPALAMEFFLLLLLVVLYLFLEGFCSYSSATHDGKDDIRVV